MANGSIDTNEQIMTSSPADSFFLRAKKTYFIPAMHVLKTYVFEAV